MRALWSLLFVAALAACGNSDNNATNSGTNGMTGPNNVPAGECSTDDECPAASDATFSNAENVVCTESLVRGNYCSECVTDAQCGAGFACRNATYCEELPPCDTGIDCGVNASDEVHLACIRGACDRCVDDLDCEADEICYSAKCATRDKVDPTCVGEPGEAPSCPGRCEIQTDDAGAATGISCIQ